MRARDYVGICLGLAIIGGCASEGTEQDMDESLQLAAPPLPAAPRITEVTATGDGCPQGKWHAALSADHEYLAVRFDSFSLDVSSRNRTAAKQCALKLMVEGEEGIAYAPTGFGIEAGHKQTAGGSLNISTTAYWDDAPEKKAVSDTPYTAPNNNGGMATGAVFDSRVWSPCSGARALHIDSNVKLESGGAKGSFSYKQMQGLTFSVRRCEAEPSGGVDAGMAGAEPNASTELEPLPPSGLVIKSVRPIGAVCRNAKVTMSPDGQNFTVTDPMSLSAASESFVYPNDHCSLAFDLVVPAGKVFALESLTIEGEASLTEGQSAFISSYPAFTGSGGPGVAGSSAVFNKSNLIEAPFSGAFSTVHRFVGDDLYFGPCDTTRQLRAEVSLTLDTAHKPASARITKFGPVKFAVKNCSNLLR